MNQTAQMKIWFLNVLRCGAKPHRRFPNLDLVVNLDLDLDANSFCTGSGARTARFQRTDAGWRIQAGTVHDQAQVQVQVKVLEVGAA
jgi:hypothetical protein